MSLFAVPMCLLFFVGVFAGYVLVLHREQRRFPWLKFVLWTLVALSIIGATGWIVAVKYNYLSTF